MGAVGKKKTRSEARLKSDKSGLEFGITVGMVVDTNDPQEMGRIRVMCPAWGDTKESPICDIPWASYCAPFGGQTSCGTRGPDPSKSQTQGAVSYGMWAIPKVGSYAFIMCLDGNPFYRVWVGSLYGQNLTHTLPMGRFFSAGSEGPFSSSEKTIEPIATNLRESFGDIKSTFEGKTRGAEQQIAGVNEEILDETISGVADERTPQRRGYQNSRNRPDIKFQTTKGNFDPQMYCITTPGLHTLIMDDSDENGKIRLRTTSGNQVILDDTNERIYVSTSDGKNWVEMDRNGNIDIFSERRVSVHAITGFNFKTEGDFRVEANNIHLNAASDLRATSNGDVHIQVSGNFNLETSSILNLKSGGDFNLEATTLMNLKSTGVLTIGGASLVLQPPSSPVSVPGVSGTTLFAYAVTKAPQHEPWGRIMSTNTDNDSSFNNSSTLELSYTDGDVGRLELGELTPRNPNWKR